MAGTFDVTDFGAVGDGIHNDLPAIQAAVNAAAAAGGGTVFLPPGVYAINTQGIDKTDAGIQLPSNVSLIGSGMGVSTIKVMDGNNSSITGIVRTPYGEETENVTVADLTIDGNRDMNPQGKVDGFFCGTIPGSTTSAYDITVLRVEVMDCSGYGIDPHERTTRLTIEDCVSHGNGLDGFTLDHIIDGVIRNNVAYNNDRHGFNVVTQTNNTSMENNVSYGNGGNGIVVQRGSFDVPYPEAIEIVGGAVYDNGAEGILLKMTNDVTIDGVHVYGNGKDGVRIAGGSGATVVNSVIENNSQARAGYYSEIAIAAYSDGVTGQILVPQGAHIEGNALTANGIVRAGYGVREIGEVDGSFIDGNVIIGMTKALTATGPQLRIETPDLIVNTQGAFSYTIPAGAFVDIDASDKLTLSVLLVDANGALIGDGSLPDWLSFDPITRTLSGDADAGDVGALNLRIVAADKTGAMESDVFTLTVQDSPAGTATPPVVAQPIADQNPEPNQAYTFTIPAGTFVDPDLGDILTYSVEMVGGGDLPDWLSFNPATLTFSGTPDEADVADFTIRVTVEDTAGNVVSDEFLMHVASEDHAPTVAAPLPDLVVNSGDSLSFTIPAGTFADVDPGENLTLSATLANGDDLPDWLHFNATTGVFSGSPEDGDSGTVQVRVTATDPTALSVSDTFTLQVKIPTVFDVRDYGAVGDGVHDDRAAIQAAADAAFAAGGGIVYLSAGTYAISTTGINKTYAGIQLGNNVSLIGEGMGVSTIKVMDGNAGDITGVVRTPFNVETHHVTVANLTIDGNRANTTGKVDGFYTGTAPGAGTAASDITVRGVEIKNASGYGFDPHEQTIRLTIEDSISHGNGLDGFTLDYLIDSVIRNNLSYGNDRHGFNVVTTTQNTLLENNVSHDNGAGGIVVQRGSEDIPSPFDLVIRGGEVYGNGKEGILIKMSYDILIDGVHVHDNFAQGIRLSGASDVTVINSLIENNAQGGSFDEINIASVFDPTTGTTYLSSGNWVLDSIINSSLAQYGIRETLDAFGGIFDGNSFGGTFARGVSRTGPQIREATPDLLVTHQQAFTYQIPVAAIVDIDAGDTVTLSLQRVDANGQLVNGGALPSWLTFDPVARTFGGDAAPSDMGDLYLRIVATDKSGDQSFDYFKILVGGGPPNTSTPPTLTAPIADQIAEPGDPFSFQLPAGTFTENDLGDVLSLSATLVGGGALPSWLSFDPQTGAFTGAPALGDTAVLQVRVTATDGSNNQVSDDFQITVATVNDTPVLNTPIADVQISADEPFSFVLPAGTFSDEETAALTLSATLADGSPLPVWLSFDPVTGAFGGTPSQADLAALQVRVTATDEGGLIVGDIFMLTVSSGVAITGTAGPDVLTGGGGLDTLIGLDGADMLDGRGGADTMNGGNGDDVYQVDNAGDTIIESFSGGLGGIDRVESTVSFSLAPFADVENLTLLGTENLNATGNNKANVLTGNSGNNILDGGSGNDTMIGGLGDDTYYVAQTQDQVIELANQGIDTVIAASTHTLADNVENLILNRDSQPGEPAMGWIM